MLVSCFVGGAVWSQPPAKEGVQTSLFVDPWEFGLTTAGGKHSLTEVLDSARGARKDLGRVFITVFANGETLWPSGSKLFPVCERSRSDPDQFGSFLQHCNQLGAEAYAALDVLQWVRPGAGAEKDAVTAHPELQELNLTFTCSRIEEGKFASPLSPAVREALVALVKDLGVHYPSLEGLLLNCRLSNGEVLGYSEAARVAYIRAKSIDPIDIILGGDEEEEQYAREWYNWRIEQVASLVGELRKAFKASHPDGKVAVLGSANFYRRKLGLRNKTLQDWLNWFLSGHVDEVLLDDPWLEEQNTGLFSGALVLVQKTGKQLLLRPLLCTRQGATLVSLQAQLEKLRKEALLHEVLVKPGSAEDLPAVAEFLHGL